MARVVKMTVTDVRERAGTAREHLQVALERLEMCGANPDRSSEAQVAASNAVSAAIAAADSLCGHALRERAADQDHQTASAMLSRVQPDGSRLAARLRRLLSDKSVLQYGTYCTRATAEKVTHDARLLVDALDQRGL